MIPDVSNLIKNVTKIELKTVFHVYEYVFSAQIAFICPNNLVDRQIYRTFVSF